MDSYFANNNKHPSTIFSINIMTIQAPVIVEGSKPTEYIAFFTSYGSIKDKMSKTSIDISDSKRGTKLHIEGR